MAGVVVRAGFDHQGAIVRNSAKLFIHGSWDCVAVALEWRPPCPAGFDTAPWHKMQVAAAMITVKTLESI
jgi:hypothetical protein